MRTRIALVAIIPIALITVSTLAQAAPVQSAQAVQKSSAGTKPASITAKPDDNTPLLANSGLLVDLIAARPVAQHPPTPAVAPAPPVVVAAVAPVPVAPAGPVDTVTPEQRAEWSRVAMCEEGGDWASDGSRFSGGLGITRSNWAAYGGEQYAPEGAMATEDEQIMVAERIQFDPPDQSGCRGW
jgi:Transglycosylase-like domain